MLIGYATTSTLDQKLASRHSFGSSNPLGCQKIFDEQASALGPRAAIEFTRTGLAATAQLGSATDFQVIAPSMSAFSERESRSPCPI